MRTQPQLSQLLQVIETLNCLDSVVACLSEGVLKYRVVSYFRAKRPQMTAIWLPLRLSHSNWGRAISPSILLILLLAE